LLAPARAIEASEMAVKTDLKSIVITKYFGYANECDGLLGTWEIKTKARIMDDN
jgi:hypothetical protein